MVNLSPDKCCGCSACYNICPHNAITMLPDKNGAIYPNIDLGKCVNCSLCEKVCPEINPPVFHTPLSTWAIKAKENEELSSVASGGIVTLISRSILKAGGVVYGCAQSNYEDIRHIRVDKEEDLDLLKNSKYVHSHIHEIYKSIKRDLLNGVKVLFIGTPCQVGGLYGYLQKTYSGLYTVDLICHGVPPQKVLTDNIQQEFGKIPDLKDLQVQFRWKTKIEKNGKVRFNVVYGTQLKYNGNKVIERSVPYSSYMAAFLSDLSFRENCHNCRYAKSQRASDLTAGDFWGLGKERPSKFNPHTGVSVALVNTDKGIEMFQGIIPNCEFEERSLSEACAINGTLNRSTPRPEGKDKFWSILNERGLREAVTVCSPEFKNANRPLTKLKTKTSSFLRAIPITHVIGKFINRNLRKLRN